MRRSDSEKNTHNPWIENQIWKHTHTTYEGVSDKNQIRIISG